MAYPFYPTVPHTCYTPLNSLPPPASQIGQDQILCGRNRPLFRRHSHALPLLRHQNSPPGGKRVRRPSDSCQHRTKHRRPGRGEGVLPRVWDGYFGHHTRPLLVPQHPRNDQSQRWGPRADLDSDLDLDPDPDLNRNLDLVLDLALNMWILKYMGIGITVWKPAKMWADFNHSHKRSWHWDVIKKRKCTLNTDVLFSNILILDPQS